MSSNEKGWRHKSQHMVGAHGITSVQFYYSLISYVRVGRWPVCKVKKRIVLPPPPVSIEYLCLICRNAISIAPLNFLHTIKNCTYLKIINFFNEELRIKINIFLCLYNECSILMDFCTTNMYIAFVNSLHDTSALLEQLKKYHYIIEEQWASFIHIRIYSLNTKWFCFQFCEVKSHSKKTLITTIWQACSLIYVSI